MSKLRVGWEYHPNDSRATLHCDERLFKHYGLVSSDKEKLGEKERELVEAVEKIRGVRDVNVSLYQLSVQRGSVFAWREVCPFVEAALVEWLGKDGVVRVRHAGSAEYGSREP